MNKFFTFQILFLAIIFCGQIYATDRIVELNSLEFKPVKMQIKLNDTVTFINTDNDFHNVYSTSKKNPIHLGAIANSDRAEYTFTNSGLFELRCAVHNDMSMIIKVE